MLKLELKVRPQPITCDPLLWILLLLIQPSLYIYIYIYILAKLQILLLKLINWMIKFIRSAIVFV